MGPGARLPRPHDLFDKPRRLRLASPTALTDDPLRVLRVWRLALQLDAEPDVDVPADLDLADVAPERVRAELKLILEHPDAAFALEGLDDLGLLVQIVPSAAAGDADPTAPAEPPRFAGRAGGRHACRDAVRRVRRAGIVAAPHVGPALARCWEHVADQRAAVLLGWLCAGVPDLDDRLHARRWSRALARAAASTAAELGKAPSAAGLGSDLFGWKCQTAFALLGRAALADDPEAHVAAYLGALDGAAGHQNPRGLPVPPLPRPILTPAEVKEAMLLPDSPQLGVMLDSLVIRQLDGEVTDEATARAFLQWAVDVAFV